MVQCCSEPAILSLRAWQMGEMRRHLGWECVYVEISGTLVLASRDVVVRFHRVQEPSAVSIGPGDGAVA